MTEGAKLFALNDDDWTFLSNDGHRGWESVAVLALLVPVRYLIRPDFFMLILVFFFSWR